MARLHARREEPLAQLVRTLRSPSFGDPGQPGSSSHNRAYFFARGERERGAHLESRPRARGSETERGRVISRPRDRSRRASAE